MFTAPQKTLLIYLTQHQRVHITEIIHFIYDGAMTKGKKWINAVGPFTGHECPICMRERPELNYYKFDCLPKAKFDEYVRQRESGIQPLVEHPCISQGYAKSVLEEC